jgi:hypothetical protein
VRRLIARIVAGAVVAPATVLVVTAPPAAAEFCGTGGGVSTVVDFGALGGGVRRECGSGSDAAAAFGSDHNLEQHPRQPGFVCRIDGAPADGDCLKTDKYWGLFVSDDGGPWVYASAGAYGQPVDDGDAVAFVWQSSASRRSPGVAPPAPAAPTKAPTTAPTKKPSKKPSKQPGKPSKQPSKAATTSPTRAPAPQASAPGSAAASSATPSASLAATPSPSETPTATATGSASVAPEAAAAVPTETTSASATEISEPEVVPAAEQTTEDGGVPTWLVVVMLVALLGATGAVAVHRRRGADSSGP